MLQPLRTAVRVASWATGAALVVFHGWLFAGQVAAGRLVDPWLVFRWLSAAALIVALLGIRAGGRSIFSRKGIAIWVLAAVLHGPAVAGRSADRFDPFNLPDAVVTVITQVVAATVLAGGLWLLAGMPARRQRYALPPPVETFVRSAAELAGARSLAFSRPPPSRS